MSVHDLLVTRRLTFYLRHYSYECKGTLQDRPYASRPSRTQQFRNPKLAPRLNSENPNELLARYKSPTSSSKPANQSKSKGVADEILAKAEADRNVHERRSRSPNRTDQPPRPARSKSASSVDSVSTISTSRSRSKSQSPFRRRLSRGESSERRPRRYSSRSMSKARGRKRQRLSVSSSSRSRSRPRHPGSQRKNRRYRTATPEDRGRPESTRRGSHRESGSPSVDKSRVTRERRSIGQDAPQTENGTYRHRGDGMTREDLDQASRQRRKRSLSPYSKRIALTQAMNS